MPPNPNNDFKRLMEWVIKCPIDAAMLLEDIETRLHELTGVAVENARFREALEHYAKKKIGGEVARKTLERGNEIARYL